MKLTKIEIKNYRLLLNAELNVDKSTTLIVGRNNTAKTSCMDLLSKVISGKSLSYDDYPLSLRKRAFVLLAQFIRGRITYEKLIKKIPKPSLKFYIDYSLDGSEDYLGALSPFIIDVDVDTTTAIIVAEYRAKMDGASLRSLFESCLSTGDDGKLDVDVDDLRERAASNFAKLFSLIIVAVNPKNINDTQIKSVIELGELFPLYTITAERDLDESCSRDSSSLKPLISSYFSLDIEKLDPKITSEVQQLRNSIEEANKKVQKESNYLLSTIINKAIGFGYPNAEELQLGVHTKLQIDNQIKDQTELTYSQLDSTEKLPSSYNGLGYKNLIKIEFQLAEFAEIIKQGSLACIPLLFIEEPESHMHPQMQQTFVSYLETFLGKISDIYIQVFLTSHSAHIANTMDFSKIRYAQKTKKGVIYKDLNTFSKEDNINIDFVKKYLTISRCDLFFADKAIFVEGASERLLLPDMINKCDKEKLFDSQTYKLPSQYYALIEIGGAYAYKFISFINFLGIPSLILTDIDSMLDGRTKATASKGITTSNSTIKWWIRTINNSPENTKINLSDIIALASADKTINRCHVEYQFIENGLCGRSLEEAIKNVNREFYDLSASPTEDDLEFTGKSKTDFALKLIMENPEYVVPQYIKNGLIWLNKQKVLI